MVETSSGTTQTVVVAPPRLQAWIPVFSGLVGAVLAGGGILVTAGSWKGEVTTHLATQDRRLDIVENNQRTYIPVLVAMQANLAYLADRARREDDRRDREQHR